MVDYKKQKRGSGYHGDPEGHSLNAQGISKPKKGEPLEIWVLGDWTWEVLKKYQRPDKEATNPHARWFCRVKSPMTMGGYDMGDVYVSEIKGSGAHRIK